LLCETKKKKLCIQVTEDRDSGEVEILNKWEVIVKYCTLNSE